ncbi:acyl-CoA thioesterase [Aquimarina agarivorans]|uniref:acyl-CoA thioesterase n=1 Tax=Aquimarina agarivorans TaxID=980584 RepID=UPI000248EA1B|nr:acyl-CoA thioesterase [Aquimarina agarivorans]
MSQFKHSEQSHITISELMLPSHSNFSGKIHGGYILSLMDQIAFACAAKYSGFYAVTASVDKVDFLQPIEVGELVTMKAAVNFVGRSSMVIGVRVEAENITTGIKKHCNSSYFTMVARDNEGKSVAVPGLILSSINDVRRFVRSAHRQAEGKSRRAKFNSSSFKLEEHMEELNNYNVKLDLTH